MKTQQKHYANTTERIKQEKKDNLQAQLNLKIDKNGVIRCYGRYSNSDLTQGAKEPKLLPKGKYFTKLVVEYYHQKILCTYTQVFSNIGTNSPRILGSSGMCSNKANTKELSKL